MSLATRSTNTMKRFSLPLKNEKRRFYKSFSVFILVLNALAIALFVYYVPQSTIRQASGIIIAVLAIPVIVFREKKPRSRFAGNALYFIMLAIAVYWAFTALWWASVAVFVLTLLSRSVNKSPEVVVSDEHVVYPAFPVRRIEWNELSNLVLKDGLLTIDFRNNRIIQQLLEPGATGLNEQEINEFCRDRLMAVQGLAPKDQ